MESNKHPAAQQLMLQLWGKATVGSDPTVDPMVAVPHSDNINCCVVGCLLLSFWLSDEFVLNL